MSKCKSRGLICSDVMKTKKKKLKNQITNKQLCEVKS
jgi:hypothetical protein